MPQHKTKTSFRKGMTSWNKGKIAWNKGREPSEETKRKISKALKGKNTWMDGVKRSEETRKRMSLARKGKPKSKEWRKRVSEIHKKRVLEGKQYNYKGGITSENRRIRKNIEFRLWREAVFARDNWTCQKYGKRGGELHPHHIQNFAQHPELRFAIDNGITFSKEAHLEFHKKYGLNNNTREQLIEFLNISNSTGTY